jgi:hypothetical protein
MFVDTVRSVIRAALILLLAVPGPAPAEVTAPPTDPVTLRVYTFNGSGCPAGTMTAEQSPDNASFEVTFTNYVASAGPGTRPTDFRKNCQINVLITVPDGWSYAISRVDYRGYATLPAGSSGRLRANFYSSGSGMPIVTPHPVRGPHDGAWEATDIIDSDWLVFSPCRTARTVNLNTELRVTVADRSTPASMAMHPPNGTVRTVYHYTWRRCG